MTGKTASTLHRDRFLLDESLVPAVADALNLVGYNIESVQTVFGQKGVTDPEIIDWCRINQAVWIHADDRARRQHRKLLQTSGIRTEWVYRTRGAMSASEQLRILSFVLPKLMKEWGDRVRYRHYRVGAANSTATPSLRRVFV